MDRRQKKINVNKVMVSVNVIIPTVNQDDYELMIVSKYRYHIKHFMTNNCHLCRQRGIVTLWHCYIVRLWHCDIVTLWDCHIVTLWHYDIVTLWQCDNGTILLSGCEMNVEGCDVGQVSRLWFFHDSPYHCDIWHMTWLRHYGQ